MGPFKTFLLESRFLLCQRRTLPHAGGLWCRHRHTFAFLNVVLFWRCHPLTSITTLGKPCAFLLYIILLLCLPAHTGKQMPMKERPRSSAAFARQKLSLELWPCSTHTRICLRGFMVLVTSTMLLNVRSSEILDYRISIQICYSVPKTFSSLYFSSLWKIRRATILE